ncbi:hypothetical protein [Haloferula sp.]|uniref:hypothetical protein n=1 Tax=Haloferula sp. TaxID=2497595 RepID=UPI00329B3622
MKSAIITLITLGMAFGAVSCSDCITNHPAAGYTKSDAYQRGYDDGCADRRAGRAHNPHINEDSEDLPSAHRNDYIWGYNAGYKCSGSVSGSK